MPAPAPCPCGLPRPYAACCGALHALERAAATAEELMRSRYAAFARGEVDYLVRTLHPDKRAALDRPGLEESVTELRWVGLKILETRDGQVGDATGIVAFEASYAAQAGLGVLRERSRFVHEDGQWYYVDGVGSESGGSTVALGLNAPCACGSGKKFKRCCRGKQAAGQGV